MKLEFKYTYLIEEFGEKKDIIDLDDDIFKNAQDIKISEKWELEDYLINYIIENTHVEGRIEDLTIFDISDIYNYYINHYPITEELACCSLYERRKKIYNYCPICGKKL
jgi:hypothetical protein